MVSKHLFLIICNDWVTIATAKTLNPDIDTTATNVETMTSGEREYMDSCYPVFFNDTENTVVHCSFFHAVMMYYDMLCCSQLLTKLLLLAVEATSMPLQCYWTLEYQWTTSLASLSPRYSTWQPTVDR